MLEIGTSWRECTPEATLDQVAPFLKDLGIDGVIEHRGVGEICIFETLRRGALSGYLNLGKGYSSLAAMASAIMEGIEMSLVEAPRVTAQALPREEFGRVVRFRHLDDDIKCVENADTIQVIKAVDLKTHANVYVPEADLFYKQAEAHGSSAIGLTNGLASGNTEAEAILHSLYELIERDAIYQDQHKIDGSQQHYCPLSLEDKAIARVHEALENEDHKLQLRALPSKTSAFVIEAVVYTSTGKGYYGKYPGWGCSIDAIIASRRAIAEAIQVWSIQEAIREGLIPAERRGGGLAVPAAIYEAIIRDPQISRPLGYWHRNGLSISPAKIWDHVIVNDFKTQCPHTIYRSLISELHDTFSALVYCARLSPDCYPFHVVRCHSHALKCPDWL